MSTKEEKLVIIDIIKKMAFKTDWPRILIVLNKSYLHFNVLHMCYGELAGIYITQFSAYLVDIVMIAFYGRRTLLGWVQ